ncbi:MAG TPA: flagellar export protein FliJ [Desulfotomaculum sp.]|jgi:flagellar FliJ protein|nr:flagellar export protein FliJ [Desulfotomaculum sp.]
MARFLFPLESVLNYRLSIEDNAKQALAKALTEYGMQRMISEEINTSLKATLNYHSFASDVAWLKHENLYREYLIDCLNKQQELVNELQQKTEDCRAKLVQAHQERLVLKKIKDKSWQRYQLEEDKKEQLQTDEVGRNTFIYRKRGY